MSLLWIIIIIIFLTLIVLIIIFLILGFIQQQKIILYKSTRNQLIKEIKSNEKMLKTNDLPIVNIKYKLPNSEMCFFLGISKIYSKNSKLDYNQNILQFENKIKSDYNYEIIMLNNFLKLKPKWEINTYEGMMYVTNYRILLEGEKKNKTIWLKDIIYTNPAIFNFSDGYKTGVIVITNGNKIYKIVNSDIKLSIILYKFLKKEESN